MKKTITYIALFFSLLFFTTNIHAAAGDEYNERWMCLKATRAQDDPAIPKYPDYVYPGGDVTNMNDAQRAQFLADVEAHPQRSLQTHGAVIRVNDDLNYRPAPNADTYIVTCIIPPKELVALMPQTFIDSLPGKKVPSEVCTTGDKDTDMMIWNNDRHGLLEQLWSVKDNFWGFTGYKGYRFLGYYKMNLKDPLRPTTHTPIRLLEGKETNTKFKTDAQGKLIDGDFVYADATVFPTERKFLSYNRLSKNAQVHGGTVGGLQQDKLDFEFVTANKDCATISWDPFGVAFDAKTLEPIPFGQMTLLVKGLAGFKQLEPEMVPGGYIQNPYPLMEDGYFSFVVPDGTYKLQPTITGYKFPSSKNILNANYSKIYSDIYYGEDIVQKGAMQHRDIPMEPVNFPNGKTYPAKLMGLFQTVDSDGKITLDGHVSHPFARVSAFCKTPQGNKGTTNVSQQAEKNGKFKVVFDPKVCDQKKGEMYGIVEVASIDLTKQFNTRSFFDNIWSWIIGKEAQAIVMPSTYTFDPILNHVEGYAYDEQNKILPETTVGIYAIGDRNPYRTVITDKNGRFTFTSNQIPNSPYELRYTDKSGKVVTTTTTRFIAQNINAIQKENIDLYSLNTTSNPASGEAVSTPSNGKPEITSSLSSQSTLSNLSSSVANGTENMIKKQLVTILAVLILISIVGAIAVIIILKKSKNESTMPN